MKLVYWYAHLLDGPRCYSIRTKTKRECDRLLRECDDPSQYAEPRKIVVEYRNALDLVIQCLSEGGIEH